MEPDYRALAYEQGVQIVRTPVAVEITPELISSLITTFNYIANRKSDAELWITNEERDKLTIAASQLATHLISMSSK